jgi:hypothetical protein
VKYGGCLANPINVRSGIGAVAKAMVMDFQHGIGIMLSWAEVDVVMTFARASPTTKFIMDRKAYQI